MTNAVFTFQKIICAGQSNKSISVLIRNDKKTTSIAYIVDNHDSWNHPHTRTEIMNYFVTGLIGSGKSTFLRIAEKYKFSTIKSDDIVQELYNDETIVLKLNKLLNCKSNGMDLKKKVKVFFFRSKENMDIIEELFHPIVHKVILDEVAKNDKLMVELPPIRKNHYLFKEFSSIYIETSKENRMKRYDLSEHEHSSFFKNMDDIQEDFKMIKDSCDIHINNDNHINSLYEYFEKGVIKL